MLKNKAIVKPLTLARTSIQIDENTLIRLRKKKGSLQAKTNQNINYDDVINYLLTKENKTKRK